MRLVFTLAFVCSITLLSAQIPALEWVKGLESSFEKRVTDGDLDDLNNIYLKGFYKSRLDFDPGPDSLNLTTQGIGDGYALSLDSNGDFKWVRSLSSENENDLSEIVIHDARAYATGADFSLKPLQTKYILEGSDTILQYFNSGKAIEVNQEGAIFLMDEFYHALDIEQADDTITLHPIGNGDSFIAKLSPTGKLIWIKQIGGTGFVSGISLQIDKEGNILMAGQFSDAIDLDSSHPGYELIADSQWNSFIVKLNADGEPLWYKLIGGTGISRLNVIRFDDENGIIIGGNFNNTVHFKDPFHPSIHNSAGEDDIFLARLDNDGNYDWVKTLGGPASQYVEDIAINTSGRIYLMGDFYGEVDFDPGTNVELVSSNGFTDIFIQEYSLKGNYRRTHHIAGPDFEYGTKLLLDNDDHMIVLGQYGKSVDFDLSTSTSSYSSYGLSDIFIAKYALCHAKDTSIEMTGCDSIAVNEEIYHASGDYVQHLETVSGCDSNLHLMLTIHHPAYSQISVDICPGDEFEGYTTSGEYEDTFLSAEGCDSVRTLYLHVLPVNDPACITSSTTVSESKEFLLYPNPTSGEVSIENLDPGFAKFQVLSMEGKVVNEFSLQNSKVMDLSGLPAGIWLLKFSNQNEVLTRRLLKW